MGDEAALIAALQNDIDDIKQELGLTPQGVYADVRIRLDILESRIGGDGQPTNVENPFFIGNDGVSISTGNGVPIENRLNGSVFLRKDGNASDGVYTRQGNSWFPVGSAGAATFQATAGGTIAKGQALRTSTSGNVIVATTNLRTLPFDCVSKAGAASSSTFDIQIAGPLDPGVANLGAGVACAVGVDVSGNLVRATDPTCASAPNWVGTCDILGNITVNPIRKDVFDVVDFGAKADFSFPNTVVTDNLAAFQAAINATESLAATGGPIPRLTKIRAVGHFYLSNTLHFRRAVHLIGDGSSDENKAPGTMLVWPKNVTGIRIHSTFSGDDPTSTSYFCRLSDLVMWCKERDTTGFGIWSSTIFYLDNVSVLNFADNCVEISADSGLLTGNASAFGLHSSRFGGSGRHGLHVFGVDANIGVIEHCEVSANLGWGIFEESSFGNTYTGIHGEGNTGEIDGVTGSITINTTLLVVNDVRAHTSPPTTSGSAAQLCVGQQIKIAGVSGTKTITAIATPNFDLSVNITINTNANATVTNAVISGGYSVDAKGHDFKTPNLPNANVSQFFGCYSENGLNAVNGQSEVYGGILASGSFMNSTAFVINNGVTKAKPLAHRDTSGVVPTETTLGSSDGTLVALSVSENDNEYFAIEWDNASKWWNFKLDGSSAWRMLQIFTVATGMRANAIGALNGIFLGDNDFGDFRHHRVATAPPVSGTWVAGDVVWSRAPATNGNVGWVCTTGGTPGTWTPFGEIIADSIRSTTISTSLVSGTDHILSIGTLSGIITVTLPASPTSGDEFIIKDANGSAASHNITIDGNGHNIDANTTFLLTTDYDDITVKYNGTKWMAL